MKKSIILIYTFLNLISCKESSYQEFDFSYSDILREDYSMKFTQSDTVYIRQNWTKNDLNINSTSPKSNTNYFSALNSIQRKKLDSFLIHTNFQEYDSIYEENIMDGSVYKFYLKKNDSVKMVKIHSSNPPIELKDFAIWILNTKTKLNLKKTSKSFTIKSKDIYYKPELRK